jgi:hypothetical protein
LKRGALTNGRTNERTNGRDVLVTPIVGILTSRTELLGKILAELAANFGPAGIVGEWRPFSHTGYYEPEMGENLMRCFVAFERLRPAQDAVHFKGWAIRAEERYLRDGRRMVNLDPGTLDANKVVLISGKHGGHKIALAEGVFADLLLWYNKGWVALPWAFPDFRDGLLFPTFTKMRSAYKESLRLASAAPTNSK